MTPRATTAILVSLHFALCPMDVTAAPPANAPTGGERVLKLHSALGEFSERPLRPRDMAVAFADLNQDGQEEAIAHLTTPSFCGTGGCTTFVFQWDGPTRTYVQIAHEPTTRLPIHVSERKGCAWSMLWVHRSGGGRPAMNHSPLVLRKGNPCDAAIPSWSDSGARVLIDK